MSYNEKLCGYSYLIDSNDTEYLLKLIRKIKGDKLVDELIEKWGEEDALFELTSRREDYTLTNGWKIMGDIDGNYAWVYLVDSGESYGDINFSTTMAQIHDKGASLIEAGIVDVEDGVDWNVFTAFAIDWYNGADCSLRF